jgi:hypothetical protein
MYIYIYVACRVFGLVAHSGHISTPRLTVFSRGVEREELETILILKELENGKSSAAGNMPSEQ